MKTQQLVRLAPRGAFTRITAFDRSAASDLWSSWSGRLALAGVALVAGYIWAYLAHPWGERGVLILSDFGEAPVEAVCALLALAVVRQERRPQARVAWALIAFALASNLVGNVVYGTWDLAGEQPFPSLADGFYLGFYPLMFVGLLWLPTASARRELFGWRVWTNVAIVILGGSIALIHFVLMPTIEQLTEDTLATAISLAYPAGDLALLAALGTIAARRPYAVDRRALAFFIVAVGAWFFADLAFAIVSAGDSYAPGSIADLIWLAGDAAFLAAACGHLLILPRRDSRAPSPPLSIGQVGPYVMLGLGLVTLVAAALEPRGELVLLVVLVVCLTAIVVARQLVDEHLRREAEAALLAEKSAAAEEAARQARRDPLTGLPNRASVREVLGAEIAASHLTGRPVTLAFLDLNFFKAVNDNLGHIAGDQLLVEVGGRLRGCVRSGDTVARLGGDEFALILPGARMEQAVEVAGRARTDLERPFRLAGIEVDISAAIGLATYPDSGAADDDELMHQADTAMYRAKRAHLGPTPYEQSFETSGPGMSDLAELRRAVEGDGLALLYQPIWERESGRTVGVEALVRWRHPARGLLGAHEFIPLATQTGLIRALDRRVLDLACEQARAWMEASMSIRTSINVSRDSLQDPGFADGVRDALARRGLPGRTIELEITEDGLLDNPAQAARFVAEMGELGIRTAIDDFGTGFSSLARLRDLPVHSLKIDQSFVRNAVLDPSDAAIIEGVVSLGHRLGMQVVAEGVEDEPTLRYLRSCGIDFAQGFFLGRPMSAEEVATRVADERDRPRARRRVLVRPSHGRNAVRREVPG